VSPSGNNPPEEDETTLAALEQDALHKYFAGRLPDRLREVDAAWRRVQETAWSEDALKDFHRLAHSLAGAGATFGFDAVTEAARRLEQRLKAVLHGLDPPLESTAVESLLEGLRRAANPPAPPSSPP
jgi:HPt (histidine-containing phosphotransfer) domain-containing protein